MKTTKEKQEVVKIIQKDKIKPNKPKNSLFYFNSIAIKSLYIFLIKSFLRGWYSSILLICMMFPIGIPILFCSFMKLNNGSSYFFGISYNYLVNSIITIFYICFSFLVYFKFTDLENRISVLGLNKSNYLLSIIFFILTCLMVNDITSFITFNLFLVINKINILVLYKWPSLFFLIFSLLLVFILVPIFLLWISFFNSIKNSLLLFEIIMTVIVFAAYSLLLTYFSISLIIKIDTISKLFLSHKSIIGLLVTLPILLILALSSVLLFNKKFSFKQ